MIAKTAEAEAAPTVSEPAVRETVVGAKFTIAWLASFLVAAVAGTIAVMAFIDNRMEGKVTGVREDMGRFREDMKEGLRDLKDEIRLLRTEKGK